MDHEGYIMKLGEDGWLNAKQIDRAIRFVQVLRILGCPVSQIAPGPDGLIGFTWRISFGYINIEITGDGRLEMYAETDGGTVSVEFPE